MRRTILAAVLVGITAVAACTADSQSAGKSPASFSTAIGTDPVILVHGNVDSQLMPLTARLKWGEDESCLIVVATNYRPERTAIPVWPKGTVPLRASSGKRGVTTPAGQQILDGDTLRGGGSWIRRGSPAYSKHTPPAGCSGHDAFFVIDSTDLRRM
jgi:hypothetical protein